jgi:lipoate-protein ligase A
MGQKKIKGTKYTIEENNMAKKKTLLNESDLVELYNLAYEQSTQDRQLILSLFNELKDMLSGSPERFAVSGETLGRYGEMLIKQTNQILELIKICQKQKEKEDNLTEADFIQINEELSNKE